MEPAKPACCCSEVILPKNMIVDAMTTYPTVAIPITCEHVSTKFTVLGHATDTTSVPTTSERSTEGDNYETRHPQSSTLTQQQKRGPAKEMPRSRRVEKRMGRCNLCYSNRETPEVYYSHRLRENGVVTCPILRGLVCPTCGATGDTAHTKKYCPLTKEEGSQNQHVYRVVRNAYGKRNIWLKY